MPERAAQHHRRLAWLTNQRKQTAAPHTHSQPSFYFRPPNPLVNQTPTHTYCVNSQCQHKTDDRIVIEPPSLLLLHLTSLPFLPLLPRRLHPMTPFKSMQPKTILPSANAPKIISKKQEGKDPIPRNLTKKTARTPAKLPLRQVCPPSLYVTCCKAHLQYKHEEKPTSSAQEQKTEGRENKRVAPTSSVGALAVVR